MSKSNDFALINSSGFSNLKVKVALNENAKRTGLMDIKEISGYNGILFLYENAKIVNIWMKNTYIALDIIFINENYEVSSIKKGIPKSLNLISSDEKVIAILEIPYGCGEKLNIMRGSKIDWMLKKASDIKNIQYYHCLEEKEKIE